MMYFIYRYEKEIAYFFTALLILFNLICLYFIIDLMDYDEIVNYLTNGEIISDSPRGLAYLLFVSGMSNLLFVIISLMSRLFSE